MLGIYFVQSKLTDGALGPIKIGRGTDPNERLRHLQVACPLELELAALPWS